MRCIGFSWCIRYICLAPERAGKCRSGNVLYAFWHARQFPLTYTHRDEGIFVLASKNRDGQIVSNVLLTMGFASIRGSSSRGGMEALVSMARELREGNDAAITPDGPRGPARKPKGGTGMMSRLAKKPVVPLATSGIPSIRFKSWDRFMLPLPFARVCIVEGKPIAPLKKGNEEEWNRDFEKSLNRVTAIADMESSVSALFFGSLISCFQTLSSLPISLWLSLHQTVENNERLGKIPNNEESPVLIIVSSNTSLPDIRPILDICSSKHIPAYITTTSPEVQSMHESNGIDCHFLPFDVPRYIDRFLSVLKPSALIVIGTDIKPVLYRKLMQTGIPALMSPGVSENDVIPSHSVLKSYYSGLLSCFSDMHVRGENERNNRIEFGIMESIISLVSSDDVSIGKIETFLSGVECLKVNYEKT